MKYFSLLPAVVLFSAATFLCASAAAPRERLSSSLRNLNERAERGEPEAVFHLARLYESGYDSIAPDTLRSIGLYRKAAEKGYAPAMNYFGFLLYRGVGGYLEANPDSAVRLIEEAALKGDAKAANNLGWLLTEGERTPHDPEKAFRWFSVAAEKGLPAAKSQLADLLKTGSGTEKDTLRAEALYIEAAGAGISDAEAKLLSMMHENYSRLPAAEALRKGLNLYLGSAPGAGVFLFERAAEEGKDSPEGAHATALLADAAARGCGTAYDNARSLRLFHEAASMGNPSAQFIVAEMMDMFPDIFPEAAEDETAARWYSRAAEAGVTDADTAYRVLYDN